MTEKYVKLSEVCDYIITGKLDANAAVEDGAYPFFTCSEKPLKIDTPAYDDDVLILAGNGEFYLFNYKGKFNAYQRDYILKINERYDKEYIYYSLKLAISALKHKSQGSIIKFLTIGMINDIRIKDIPLSDQRDIARKISALDEKIALNEQLNHNLEAMAQAIYDYWFVQFDFPDENGKPYKSNGGKMVWNEKLKREIPEGWSIVGLDELFILQRGVSYKPEESSDQPLPNYLPILRANNIDFGSIRWAGLVYVDNKRVSSQQIIKKDDILIVMSSGSKEHIGKIAVAYSDMRCSYGAFCAKLTPKKNCFSYLRSVLQSNSFRNFLKIYLTSTSINNINQTLLNSFKIALPPSEFLMRFQTLVGTIYKLISTNHNNSKSIADTRDYLLPLLMNGQVTVTPQGEELNYDLAA